MKGMNMKDLQIIPVEELASIVVSDVLNARTKLKCWEALHARVDELQGAAWLRLSSGERGMIRRALDTDLSSVGFPVAA